MYSNKSNKMYARYSRRMYKTLRKNIEVKL